jgi:hypothetical protein
LAGYVECWTVVNVVRIDIDMAKRESPSTNKFFRISDLLNKESDDYQTFCAFVVSCVGIK